MSQVGNAQIVSFTDIDLERAHLLASRVPGAAAFSDWRSDALWAGLDLVVVATPNAHLATITTEALTRGKHVLVEKPAARSLDDLASAISARKSSSALARVGFNHRYHPAVLQMRKLISEGAIGPLMYLRAVYGHGGRLGYEHEWRADPKISGGGELIDQGVHLIDLARVLLGEFVSIEGHAQTSFWNMPVDDNAFLILRTESGQTAALHASCSEWKNQFVLEVYGRTGKLRIDGLGGSYGKECLTFYRMLPEMGPPEITRWEYDAPDRSWETEFVEFLEDIRLGRPPAASLDDARRALMIVEEVYRRSGYDHHA
jgi:predicted dehydrogenase